MSGGYWKRMGSGTGNSPDTMVWGEWHWVPFQPFTLYVPPVEPPRPFPPRGVPAYHPTEHQPTRVGGTEA